MNIDDYDAAAYPLRLLCHCFNSLNISSAVVPKSFACAERLDVLGSEAPLSHFETACLLTPSASATNSWVILHSIRCRLITSPRDFAMSDFSFLTGSDLRYFLNAMIKRYIKYTKTAMIKRKIGNTIKTGNLKNILSTSFSMRLYLFFSGCSTNYCATLRLQIEK